MQCHVIIQAGTGYYKHDEHILRSSTMDVHPNFSEAPHLTLLGLQSRYGDKLLWIWVVCPQNGTAVLKGLRSSTPPPKTGFIKNGIASRWIIQWTKCFSKQDCYSNDFGVKDPRHSKNFLAEMCHLYIVERVFYGQRKNKKNRERK